MAASEAGARRGQVVIAGRLEPPLAEQRATSIVCTMGSHRLSDEVAAMRQEPNRTLRTSDTGH